MFCMRQTTYNCVCASVVFDDNRSRVTRAVRAGRCLKRPYSDDDDDGDTRELYAAI